MGANLGRLSFIMAFTQAKRLGMSISSIQEDACKNG